MAACWGRQISLLPIRVHMGPLPKPLALTAYMTTAPLFLLFQRSFLKKCAPGKSVGGAGGGGGQKGVKDHRLRYSGAQSLVFSWRYFSRVGAPQRLVGTNGARWFVR